MSSTRLPTLFVSHGGGPWPFVDGMREMFARTAEAFRALPAGLPARPKAVLVITGHWEAAQFSVSTSAQPPMDYDYSGFPAHTYTLQYPAKGSPELAARVTELLVGGGIACKADPARGFDHGTFVPLGLMYPQADMPIVLLSMKSGYDAAEHFRVGELLAPLRDEGILIVGSGLTYHNMRGFGNPASTQVAAAFEQYLNRAVTQSDAAVRRQMLLDWEQAPAARQAHPREDHLIPLMVVAGAAGSDPGERILLDHVMAVDMASYQFG
ncbi:dioxygenase [Rhodoferax lacus]|uniref:Dioxygenase n=1 Tax=Rhodoferax lacus TaxID=2184758 RepID=A0A3E1RDB3_9BURK|nr:class III extradiol ring-cleavage dioxygenase [Rhodoferax lacus]RFO97358.1 dioxygenase [Rhodoferax lacus]